MRRSAIGPAGDGPAAAGSARPQPGSAQPEADGRRNPLDPQQVWAEAQRSKAQKAAGPSQEHETSMDDPRFEPAREDDLPRTFLREREAQQQRAREARNAYSGAPSGEPSMQAYRPDEPPGGGVTVSRFDISYFRLTWFLVKVALAAIPALLILGLLMFAIGQAAQMLFPWLVKMKINITFH